MKSHLHAKGMLVAIAASLLFPAIASANHCEEVRCSYNDRIERLEASYRHDRQTMYAAFECERERLNELLHRARRHANRHRHAIAEVKSLKREIRAAHHSVHANMDELECAFNTRRRELVAERNAAMRACRMGSCGACGTPVVVERPSHRHGESRFGGTLELAPPRRPLHDDGPYGAPGPRYLPGNGLPPVPTPDGVNWNGHRRPHRVEARSVNWVDMVSLLLSR